MAEGTITKLVENGYDDLWKILMANKNELVEIEGLGCTIINKLYNSINEGLNNRYIYEIMAASQIFGRGIAVKKFKLIIDDYPNIIDIYKQKGKNHTSQLINSINGFDNKTTQKIIDNFDNFILFFDKLLLIKPNILYKEEENIQDNINKQTKLKLSQYIGKTIVFTGFRDNDIKKELEKNGIKIKDSISKNTDIVVAKDMNENSNKINMAKQLNILLISKDEFYKSIGK
jgi:NAD-dependent DNA ligase